MRVSSFGEFHKCSLKAFLEPINNRLLSQFIYLFFPFWGTAFGSDSDNLHLLHNHERDQVVYTGTHDNDTVSPQPCICFKLIFSTVHCFLFSVLHLHVFRLWVGGRTWKRKRGPQWVSWETLNLINPVNVCKFHSSTHTQVEEETAIVFHSFIKIK